MSSQMLTTQCCIAGGGPAGIMLGYLLARAGVKVIVLEKHADFLRDFRGDTVHPSTLEIMHELGLLDAFLKLPHERVTEIAAEIDNKRIRVADFTQLPTKCKFIAFLPQWDFLDFIAAQAKRYESFSLMMRSRVDGLLEENGRIKGVTAQTPEGNLEVRADLVVGADGRTSAVRTLAGLKVQDVGAPMDVLWMRISRKENDPPQSLGRIGAGTMFVMLNRGNYWQCGYLIRKGACEELRSEGIEAFRDRIVKSAPFLADRVEELRSFDDVKLLTVKIDWLNQWYRDGLLCIGDAAHAMSPVGGVGINLAIQDAVAAANILHKPLLDGLCTAEDLHKVQLRRSYPTRMTQRLQVAIQKKVIRQVLNGDAQPKVPWVLQLPNLFPPLRGIAATVIGIGFRPEHVYLSEANRQQLLPSS